MGKHRIYAENELDCYFAQIMSAKDSLLMSINDKFEFELDERHVNLSSINLRLRGMNFGRNSSLISPVAQHDE